MSFGPIETSKKNARTRTKARFRLPLIALTALTPCYETASADTPVISKTIKERNKQSTTSKSKAHPAQAARLSQKHAQTNTPLMSKEAVEVSIVGMGSTRQVQAMKKEEFRTFAPGTNPMKMLNKLPGITFMSSDPLGIDIWSWDMYVRGFDVGALAFTIDGIPAMDIQNLVSQSNLGGVNVSQGAGGVDVPSVSNLGGHVAWSTDAPKDKMGGRLSQTFGSYSTYDTFMRFDSGKIGKHGTKFYVSYDRASEGQWVGDGSEFREVVNARLDHPINDHSHLQAFFSYANNSSDPYADLSMEMLHKLGQRVTYFKNDYAAAYKTALWAQGLPGGQLPAGYASLSDPADASYYDGPNRFKNYLTYLKYNNHISEHLTFDLSLYGIGENHHGLWANPYLMAPNGSPITEQDVHDTTQEGGINASVKYRIEKHLIEGGIWYDRKNVSYEKNLYEEPVLGEGSPLNTLNALPNSAMYAQEYKTHFNMNTLQFHLQDTYRPIKGLSINAGFRSIIYNGTSHIDYNNPDYTGQDSLPHGTLSYNAAFLPQVGITYRINSHNEIFFDFSKNMSVFQPGRYNSSSPWSAADWSTYNYVKHNVKPETDYVYEVGYRYSSQYVHALVDLYHTDYRNRTGSITVGPIVNAESVLQNVGSVQMYGADATLIVTPIKGLNITNSFSYNHSTYDNDITTGGVTYNLKGQREVNYPQFMYKASASYTFHNWTNHIDAAFTSSRPLSYTNDVKVPGYWLVNMGSSYAVPIRSGRAGTLTFSFNVYNLMNDQYIGQLGENGNPLSGDYQSFNMGAPRTYYGSIAYDF